MTDETRETLELLYCYAASRAEWHPSLMAVTDPGWDEDDLAECVEQAAHWGRRALALRDVLTPRVCGRCRHADTESARPGWCYCAAPMRPAQVGIDEHDRRYPFHHKAVPLDEGCKGWQAREGEG